MHSYVIVSFFDKNFPELFPGIDWPLHTTIIRNFSSSKGVSELIHILDAACLGTKEINTRGKAREMFGFDKDVSVTELEKTTELESFQNKVTQYLKDLIEPIGPQYDSYRPHVTDRHGIKIGIGQNVIISSISLVEILGAERKVLHTITF